MQDFKKSLYPFFTKNLLFFAGGAVGASLISQSLQDFFISILAIGAIFHFLSVGKAMGRRILFDKVSLVLFLGWFVVAAFGILFNYGFNAGYLAPLWKFKWIFIFYCMAYIFRYSEINVKDVLKNLLGWVAIPAIYCWATIIFKTEFLYPDEHFYRAVGLINSSTYHAHAGGAIFAFLGALFIYFFNQLNIRQKAIYLVLGILLGGSIYFTYTRGIYGALVLGFIIGLFMWRPLWSLYASLLIGACLFVLVKLDPTMAGRVAVTFDRSKFDMGRVAVFQSHLQMYKDHPILGMGFDVYKDYSKSKPYSDAFGVPDVLNNSHSHNQYLQTLSMTGTLGFLFFLGLCLYFLILNFSLLKKSKKGSMVFGLSFASMVAQIEVLSGFLTDQSFEYAKIRIVILALWAFVYALYFKYQELTENK